MLSFGVARARSCHPVVTGSRNHFTESAEHTKTTDIPKAPLSTTATIVSRPAAHRNETKSSIFLLRRRMSQQGQIPSEWSFYALGAILILFGVAFFIIPLIAKSGLLSGFKIPWIILYVYRSDGFTFVTSPILILISVASLILFALRR